MKVSYVCGILSVKYVGLENSRYNLSMFQLEIHMKSLQAGERQGNSGYTPRTSFLTASDAPENHGLYENVANGNRNK